MAETWGRSLLSLSLGELRSVNAPQNYGPLRPGADISDSISQTLVAPREDPPCSWHLWAGQLPSAKGKSMEKGKSTGGWAHRPGKGLPQHPPRWPTAQPSGPFSVVSLCTTLLNEPWTCISLNSFVPSLLFLPTFAHPVSSAQNPFPPPHLPSEAT